MRQINGTAIRVIRKLTGLTQVVLAERASISPSHLNKIEHGVEQGRDETAARIAIGLGVPIEAIAPTVPVPVPVTEPAET